MASVTLTTLWLNDALDMSDRLSVSYLEKLDAAPQIQGEFRQMAANRVRLVTTTALQQRLNVALKAVTAEQRRWVDAHAGRTMLVRDDRGRRFFAAYLAPATSEHRYNAEADVSLSLTELTFDEAV